MAERDSKNTAKLTANVHFTSHKSPPVKLFWKPYDRPDKAIVQYHVVSCHVCDKWFILGPKCDASL